MTDGSSGHIGTPGCGRLFQGGFCGCRLCTCEGKFQIIGVHPEDGDIIINHQLDCPLYWEDEGS